MQTTGNLGLKKPEGTDIVDIADLNGNMDILDNAVNGKVDKVTGKQLSTNDYTAAEKTKLAGIATGANNYMHPNHTGDVTSNGDGVTAIAAGAIVNADVNANASISWSKLDTTNEIMDSDISSEAYIDMKKIGTGLVNNETLNFIKGVTSPIQAQLNIRAQQTTADITYYVRTDGNDNNTGLANTAAGAFKTIGKAISVIPRIVNHKVSINIAVGTYAEEVQINGFNGSGKININDDVENLTTNYSIQLLRISNCGLPLDVRGLNAQTTTAQAFMVENCTNAQFFYCQATGATATYHAFVIHSSKVYAYGCRASNKYVGFYAGQNSTVLVWSADGSGNKVSLMGAEGGCLTYNGTYPTSPTVSAISMQNGGTVTSGVINPWGDNTLSSRSAMRASILQPHLISKGSFTKLQFSVVHQDYLNEFNTSLYRFTAKKTGWYLVSGAVGNSASPPGMRITLSAFVDGARQLDLGSFSNSGTQGALYTQGAAPMLLLAGSYVELYALAEGIDMNVVTGAVVSNFSVTQLA
jgi:hypothetical protein